MAFDGVFEGLALGIDRLRFTRLMGKRSNGTLREHTAKNGSPFKIGLGLIHTGVKEPHFFHFLLLFLFESHSHYA
jgi:hypothetical protein